jgi:sugar-specific transcriptional regulator TrmB
MTGNLLTWLLSTGLDEQRAKLYLLALNKGEARASELAEQLGVSRTAIYDNLKFLEQRGFLTKINEGKRQFFVPLHPDELYKRVDAQREQLKALLPDFLALFAAKAENPFVQLFRGKFAAREVYEDILRVAPPEYCYISDPNQTSRVVDRKYIKDWVARRVEKRIKVRAIRAYADEPIIDPIFAENQKLLRQVRYLPASIVIRSTVYVYGNNIGIISGTREKNAVIIYSPDLAFSGRQIFDMLWEVCRVKGR